jgi:hypothetical protein
VRNFRTNGNLFPISGEQPAEDLNVTNVAIRMIFEPSPADSFEVVGVDSELFAAVLSLFQDDKSP